MSKAHDRRLQALEATKAGGLGLRIFQQSLTAVSSTHLDVSKRQLQANARLIYESSLAQTITTGKQVFMTELAAAAAAQMDQLSRTFVDTVSSQVVIPTVMEAAAVSYTHLDVYKRQVFDIPVTADAPVLVKV